MADVTSAVCLSLWSVADAASAVCLCGVWLTQPVLCLSLWSVADEASAVCLCGVWLMQPVLCVCLCGVWLMQPVLCVVWQEVERMHTDTVTTYRTHLLSAVQVIITIIFYLSFFHWTTSAENKT